MGVVIGMGEDTELLKAALKAIWVCIGKGLNSHMMELGLIFWIMCRPCIGMSMIWGYGLFV